MKAASANVVPNAILKEGFLLRADRMREDSIRCLNLSIPNISTPYRDATFFCPPHVPLENAHLDRKEGLKIWSMGRMSTHLDSYDRNSCEQDQRLGENAHKDT